MERETPFLILRDETRPHQTAHSKESEIAVEKMEPAHTTPPASKEIEIAVEKLVYGGGGLGRWAGRVVLTPFTLPGEQVRVALQQEKSDVAYGRLLSVLSPAPERVSPRCPYFTHCGGCHYQHASYEYELAQKEAILRETLRRVGRLQPPGRIEVVAGPEWEYRNRAQFHLERRRIGFMSAGSHDLCPVDQLPGLVSAPERRPGRTRRDGARPPVPAVPAVRSSCSPTKPRSNSTFALPAAASQNPSSTGAPSESRARPRRPSSTPAAGERFRVSRRSFFQVNRFLVERLVETAVGEARGDTALDLYAGVGLFTLPLARRFGEVSAVESEDSAVRDLEFNAARAGLGVKIHRGAAEAYLDQAGDCPDLVLADPPRAGLGRHTVARLLALRPRNLVIVSCDPATLARDLAALVGGGFSLERLTLVDLFPRTCHIEAVAELEFILSAA